MRGRLGLVLGFGAGYYLGAKAGRERYEEINRYVQRFRGTQVGEVFDTAASKTKEVVGTAVDRAQDGIERVDADALADRVAPDAGASTFATTTTTSGVDTTGIIVATESDVVAAVEDVPPYTKPL